MKIELIKSGINKDNQDYSNLLYSIDNGRFKSLLEQLCIKKRCFECGYFLPEKQVFYRCAIMGKCIGVTLYPDLKKYLIDKIKENI